MSELLFVIIVLIVLAFCFPLGLGILAVWSFERVSDKRPRGIVPEPAPRRVSIYDLIDE